MFREITTRICGSLDLDAALADTYAYLRRIAPLDELGLSIFERELGAFRIISLVNADGALPPAERPTLAYLSEASRRLVGAGPFRRVRLVTPGDDPISRDLQPFFVGGVPSSVLLLHLSLREQGIGAMVAITHGDRVLGPEHERRFEMLNAPFAIALSNALRFREVEALRDRLADDNRALAEEIRHVTGDAVVGADFGLRRVMELVRQVAPRPSPVLLLGETGVGKEVVANALHAASPRRDGPLVRVNCGAIPETLVDSELFGHERGAFTGAVGRQRGRFERAHGGTLFLDEVAELPLPAQVRLLRVLQTGELERVGGSAPVKVDVRVIAATHRDLEAMVAAGAFRQDLWFRLNVFPIRIPPLRERRGDIPALTVHLLERKAREMNLPGSPRLGPGALDRLVGYDWPGNVRELQNVLERALIVSGGRPLAFEELGPAPARLAPRPEPAVAGQDLAPLDVVVAAHLRRALEVCHGRVEGPHGAAERLGLNPSTLRHRLRKLGIPFGRPR